MTSEKWRRAGLHQRPRRLRRSQNLRDLCCETRLSAKDFIYPLFIQEQEPTAIAAMPGQKRHNTDSLLRTCEQLMEHGIPGVALFPALTDDLKDHQASESWNPQGLLPRSVRAIKQRFPELVVISDVAMDPYSNEGHDGVVHQGEILNDETLEVLAKMALAQAEAGVDMIGPSDMMDGRIGYLRQALDESNFSHVGILSYAAKYASSFYGPFREALDSAPKSGDKKTYQMDPGNHREALRELRLDLQQGADIVMVKPALSYLDVIHHVKAVSSVPVAAYNVSGEYSMIKAAAQKGWLDEKSTALESLLSIKRAGADMILTYWALEACQWL